MRGRVEIAGEITLADGSMLVLTNHYPAEVRVSNLLRLNPDGSEAWAAELGDPQMGHYVSAEVINEQIFANSFDCFRVQIDPDTGKLLDKIFTK